MAKDKALLKAIVKEQLFTLGQINEKATKAKNNHRSRLAEIEKQKVNFSEEYLKDLQGKAQADMQAANQALYGDAMTQIEKLKSALVELHSSLDLGNPALTNALSLISVVGPDLGVENILRINAPFAGDQPSLRLLQAAYRAKGVAFDGGLDKQIYDPETAIQAIGSQVYAALQQGGSLNALAGAVGKLAAFELLEFETFPDTVGFSEAMRAGAGLTGNGLS
jgi:hypothetical protein